MYKYCTQHLYALVYPFQGATQVFIATCPYVPPFPFEIISLEVTLGTYRYQLLFTKSALNVFEIMIMAITNSVVINMVFKIRKSSVKG